MKNLKVHFIHVGNMNNKGTQALFVSDVSTVKEVDANAEISVSTTDKVGVGNLKLPVKILPPMVDLPYDQADQISKKLGFGRSKLSYKILMFSQFVLLPLQTFLSLLSVLASKAGAKGIYRSEVIQEIKHSDVVVSHSDESFKETASSLPLNPIWAFTWWSMLFSRTMDIVVARSLGKPVVLFPNSVGPFRTSLGRFMAKLSLNSCDYLLIRDPISYQILEKLNISASKILTYDTALLFNQHSLESNASFSAPVIGVSAGVYSNSISKASVEKYVDAHAKSLDAAIEKYGFSVAFLPHYISGFSDDDIDISKRIIEKMQNQQHIQLVITDGVSEFKSLLSKMDLVVSSKMHPAILAVTSYVPVVCIVYDHKQTGFFQRLSMSDCTLDIGDVSHEQLLAKIEYAWQRQAQLKASLAEQIPKWQKNVKTTITRVLSSYTG